MTGITWWWAHEKMADGGWHHRPFYVEAEMRDWIAEKPALRHASGELNVIDWLRDDQEGGEAIAASA